MLGFARGRRPGRDLGLPPGAADGFTLLNRPITDEHRKHAGEVWLSTYVVDALPPASGSVSGYSVYQEWQGAPGRREERCTSRRGVGPRVVREVGDDRVTICLGPNPTAAARNYWSSVPFTDDLDRVPWLGS